MSSLSLRLSFHRPRKRLWWNELHTNLVIILLPHLSPCSYSSAPHQKSGAGIAPHRTPSENHPVQELQLVLKSGKADICLFQEALFAVVHISHFHTTLYLFSKDLAGTACLVCPSISWSKHVRSSDPFQLLLRSTC